MSSPLDKASPRLFIAFMLASFTWKLLLFAGLLLLKEQVDAGSAPMWWWMVVTSICAGFLDVGAILGLAYTDKFMMVADKALVK